VLCCRSDVRGGHVVGRVAGDLKAIETGECQSMPFIQCTCVRIQAAW